MSLYRIKHVETSWFHHRTFIVKTIVFEEGATAHGIASITYTLVVVSQRVVVHDSQCKEEQLMKYPLDASILCNLKVPSNLQIINLYYTAGFILS